MDYTKCPICKEPLSKDITIGDCDEIFVECSNCGKYGMTHELYDDEIAPRDDIAIEKAAAVLRKHKDDKLWPFFSRDKCTVPKGYKNYPNVQT